MQIEENKRRYVQFTFRAFLGTREADVISWLNQTHSRSLARERANQALCSAWLSLVYLDEGHRSTEELQQIAQEMNHRMVNQILYVCQTFGIDPPRILEAQSDKSHAIDALQSLLNQLQEGRSTQGYASGPIADANQEPIQKPTKPTVLEDLKGLDLSIPDNMLADING